MFDLYLSGLRIPKDAQELYDTVMVTIEPDLVSTSIPLLKEKYQYESPRELKERGRRYYTALQKCKNILRSVNLTHGSEKLRDMVIHALEEISREQDNNDLKNLDAHFQTHE